LAAVLLCSLLGCATPNNSAADNPPADGSSPAGAPAAAAPEEAPPPAPPAAAPAPAPTPAQAAGTATAAPREDAVKHWSLSERDKTLKGALQKWSQAAGWRLVWELGVDYRIDASASIDGTFETAISEVVKNMEHADVPPKAIFYRGNQVLRVVPRGVE
jgi:hypothetical protein